jgi:hypothetical protein
MTLATKIYEIGVSLEEDRPQINFEIQGKIDWALIDECLQGIRPISEYHLINIVMDNESFFEWDYYACPGTLGLWSERAIQILGKEAFENYELVPAELGNQNFFFLKCLKRLDCIDKINSIYEHLPSNPDRFMSVQKYAFHMNNIDRKYIFSLPETERLYCSEIYAQSIVENLKGFRVLELS